MLLTVTKTERGATPKLLGREWNNIHRAAAENAGWYWHQHFRPLHFKNLATRRYGYAFRQGENLQGAKGFRSSYTGQKLRKMGHTRPLTFTGNSETLAAYPNIKATATHGQFGSAKVTIAMNCPTLNLRRWPSSPNMRKELITVIPEEIAEISRETEKFLAERFRLITLTEVTTFRSSGPI